MQWDGNGNITRTYYPEQDRDNDIAILASKFETYMAQEKTLVENCVTLDSQTKLTSNLDINNKRLLKVADGIVDTDGVNKLQLDTVDNKFNDLGLPDNYVSSLDIEWVDADTIQAKGYLRDDTNSYDFNVANFIISENYTFSFELSYYAFFVNRSDVITLEFDDNVSGTNLASYDYKALICQVYTDASSALKANTILSFTNDNSLVDKWQSDDLTGWYEIRKDGWVEQGGRVYSNADTANTINLLVQMLDANYTVLINHGVNGVYSAAINGRHTDEPFAFTTTNFKAWSFGSTGINYIQWRAFGYKGA